MALAQLYIGADHFDKGSIMRLEPPSVRVAAPYRTAHPTMLLSMLGGLPDDVPPQILSEIVGE
jgi:hypothetical protein